MNIPDDYVTLEQFRICDSLRAKIIILPVNIRYSLKKERERKRVQTDIFRDLVSVTEARTTLSMPETSRELS